MEECFEKLALVTTPTRAWLDANLGRCRSRFMVASPYIGSCLLDLSQSIAPGVHRSLLTSTDLRSFAMGASDIHALSKISKEGVNVLSLNRLHAKTYIIDDTCALVTSANATHSGLTRNWECGVAIRSSEMVNSLAEQLLSGFGSPEPPLRVNENDLTAMRTAVEAIRPLLRPLQKIKALIDQQVEELEGIEILNRAAVLSGFQGDSPLRAFLCSRKTRSRWMTFFWFVRRMPSRCTPQIRTFEPNSANSFNGCVISVLFPFSVKGGIESASSFPGRTSNDSHDVAPTSRHGVGLFRYTRICTSKGRGSSDRRCGLHLENIRPIKLARTWCATGRPIRLLRVTGRFAVNNRNGR